MDKEAPNIPFVRRALLALACFASLPFYRRFGSVMLVVAIGSLLVVACYGMVAGAIVSVVVWHTPPASLMLMVALGLLFNILGNFFYVVSRTALLVWLLNLPEALSKDNILYIEFCLQILRTPHEMETVCEWYDGVPEILAEAGKRLAQPA